MITIGADPELFFVDASGNFVSAYGHVPGTKNDPEPTDFGAVQLDGHAVEFNIFPTSDVNEFVDLLRAGIDFCKGLAANVGCSLSFSPVAVFSPEHFDMLPPESKVLGCSPDFNGYTGQVNTAPEIAEIPIRTSSGHVHIGYPCEPEFWHGAGFEQRLSLVQHLGLRLETVAKAWEVPASKDRRNYYGDNFAFRPKPYGVELRQLDALWLTDERWMRLVFSTVRDNTETFLGNRTSVAA